MPRRRPAAPAAPAAPVDEPLTPTTATCPVCLCVLIRPITMPCVPVRHTLCAPCFDSVVEKAALSCPLCRTRLSVWLRRARRAGSLVDESLWRRLQEEYPEKVQARLEGREADFSEEVPAPAAPLLSAPGEIRREFERQLEAARGEEQERRSRAERASRDLIDRLQQETAEAARRRQEQERRDAELARGVMREELLSPPRPVATVGDLPRPAAAAGVKPRASTSGLPVRGPMDVYVGQLTPRVGGKRPVSPAQTRAAASAEEPAPFVAATPSPTGSGKENSDPAAVGADRCGSDHSSDSIRAELRHFRPIRAAPRSPPKRRPDGVLGAPPVVRAVARVLEARGEDRAAQRVGKEVMGVRDCGGSGDDGGRLTAGKRPADGQDGGRLAKRRQAETVSDEERGPPVLDRPPPPQEEDTETELPVLTPLQNQQPSQEQDSEELPFLTPQSPASQERWPEPEFDLFSPELLAEQREAERRLELELADRRLAERLQKELNTPPPVDRSKGSADAYSLRGAGWGSPPARAGQRRPSAGGGRRQPGRRDRAQMSIQESLGRSTRGARAGR